MAKKKNPSAKRPGQPMPDISSEGEKMIAQRGGAGRGQGRKPIAKTGELMRSRPIRMTDEQWEKCRRLGGAAWVRAKIKAALG